MLRSRTRLRLSGKTAAAIRWSVRQTLLSSAPAFAACLLAPLFATLFAPVTAAAADLDNATGKPAVDQPEGASRWTLSVEALALDRIGGVDRTLVERVPGTEPFYSTFTGTGSEAFNSSQFQPGFSAGPKIGLIYRGDSGYGAEFTYFNIFNQSATNATGPDTPADWLVMKAPGLFWQTQDFPYQAMVWSDTTNLTVPRPTGGWLSPAASPCWPDFVGSS